MIRIPTYHWLRPFLLFTALFMLIACSTKKNTFSRRFYHNLTAHYNVYWNGKEAMLEAEKELETMADDNYNEILPVYNYGTKAEATTIAPLLDRAIEKGSKTILKHSMEFGGREYVKWIDDAYLLLGKSYFYKQDYYSARRSFNFVMREYEYNNSKYDAMLWLAQTYDELEEYEKSEALLNLIEKEFKEGLVYRKAANKLPLVYANHLIKKGEPFFAIDYLYDGIDVTGKKQLKTRMKFILAQIYQAEGDYEDASRLYAEVIKRNPAYKMAFNAKINLARSYREGTGDSDEINRILARMLNDEKNKEFQDQIYNALAEVAFAEDLDSLGVHYLKMSVRTSVSNNYQKATSALQLADIYFLMPDYENAQAYYDTAVQFLPKEYTNYEEISLKADKLSDLVVNLQTIHLEDSLQKLAMMSEDERYAIIDKIIEDVIAEEERRAELEALAQAQAEMGAMGGGGPSFGGGDGNWYFYNAQTKSSGYSAFVQKWGRRKLEDLWRLRDKQVSAFEEEFITEVSIDSLVSDSTLLMIKDPHSRQYYLQDIPFTVEERQESDQSIINSFYNLGLIYREGLNDLPKAIETYEELLDRYPDNEYQLQAYYQLYRLFFDLEDEERTNYYKMLIINRYPDSDYAKIIEDPDYYQELEKRQNQLAVLYSDTYDAFVDGRYFTVIDNCNLALAQYSDSSALIPKFEYLKAVSIGKIDVVDSLVVALRRIVDTYPGSEVEPMAQDILDYITKERPEFAREEQAEEADSVIIFPYTYNPEITHIYVMIAKRQGVKLNPTKVKISDFNQKYYRIKELTINSLLFDRNNYLISVGNFTTAEEALDYYNTIKDNEYVFSDISITNVQQFIISTDNYPILFKEKDNELYGLYFEQEYLGQ